MLLGVRFRESWYKTLSKGDLRSKLRYIPLKGYLVVKWYHIFENLHLLITIPGIYF